MRLGGYDPQMYLAEDLDLWLRLGEVGELAIMPQAMVGVRLRRGSVSGRAPGRQLEVARRACTAAWKRRGIVGQFEAAEPSRPVGTRSSRLRFAQLYGWWAFCSGQRRTAAIYGLKCLALAPWRPEGLRLLICALVKRPPKALAAQRNLA